MQHLWSFWVMDAFEKMVHCLVLRCDIMTPAWDNDMLLYFVICFHFAGVDSCLNHGTGTVGTVEE